MDYILDQGTHSALARYTQGNNNFSLEALRGYMQQGKVLQFIGIIFLTKKYYTTIMTNYITFFLQ